MKQTKISKGIMEEVLRQRVSKENERLIEKANKNKEKLDLKPQLKELVSLYDELTMKALVLRKKHRVEFSGWHNYGEYGATLLTGDKAFRLQQKARTNSLYVQNGYRDSIAKVYSSIPEHNKVAQKINNDFFELLLMCETGTNEELRKAFIDFVNK